MAENRKYGGGGGGGPPRNKRPKNTHCFAIAQRYPVNMGSIQDELRKTLQHVSIHLKSSDSIEVSGVNMNDVELAEPIIRRLIRNFIMPVANSHDNPPPLVVPVAPYEIIGLNRTRHESLPPAKLFIDKCFGKRTELVAATLKKGNVEKATPFQAHVWPVLMNGYDLIAVGASEILDYLLPAMVHCGQRDGVATGTIVVVLTHDFVPRGK